MKYLIRAIRTKPRNGFDSLLAGISRSSEIRVSRSANQILTGSATEAIRLKQIGCHNVTVIRMVNGNFPELNLDSYPTPDLRIIHLGSLETTANRDGLTTYLSTAHGCTLALCTERGTSIELIIVGDASRIKPSLRELLRQEKIVLRGYVSDLSSMLRPFDIAILPYTQDSGYRTKLPLLMSHAQIIVATRAAVAGSQLPGLEQVCILLDRVDEFPEKIAWLSSHPEERKRLGKASRTFAEKFFNLPAVQSSYTDLLRQLDELPRCKF